MTSERKNYTINYTKFPFFSLIFDAMDTEVDNTIQKFLLKESQEKRLETLETHRQFIDDIVLKKKGIRFRTYFRSWLYHISTKIFDDDDAEYDEICKFGRGMWDMDRIGRTFDKSEQAIIVKIAKGYGAFDY